jgi:ketosteroid isomerase-like protein
MHVWRYVGLGLGLLVVAFVISSCATMRETSLTEVRAAIEAGSKQWEAGVRSGSGAAIAALYAADAQVFPPNGDIVSGTEAITKFWQDFIDSGATDVKLTVLDVEAQGNLAVEVGKYEDIGEGGKVGDSGKYVAVWKRAGGEWKIYRDIWNTSLPAPAP